MSHSLGPSAPAGRPRSRRTRVAAFAAAFALTLTVTGAFASPASASDTRTPLFGVTGMTLADSTLTTWGSDTGMVGYSLSFYAQLSFSDGASATGQQIAVTREQPDGTSATVGSFTTDADGSAYITDTPTQAGENIYQLEWAGNSTYQGSTATRRFVVEAVRSFVRLDGPTGAEAGKPLMLNGTLTIDGHLPTSPQTIALSRTIANNYGIVSEEIGAATTAGDGTYTFTDNPTEGGRYQYTATYYGDANTGLSTDDHNVTVTSDNSRIYANMWQPVYVNEEYTLNGGISFDVGACTGAMTIHLTRQIGTGAKVQLPDLTTDPYACSFYLHDKVSIPGTVSYTVSWDGDATHKGASTVVTGTVSKQPTYIDATAADFYLLPGQAAYITGTIHCRTGALQVSVKLSVTRINPDGSVTRLRDVTTAKNGTFSFRDNNLPTVDLTTTQYAEFEYDISYAGNDVYEAGSTGLLLYVTRTG
jgi:hypothetical protein